MEVQINGHQVYYETDGPKDGKPVVLLHHGIGSTYSWKGQISALASAGYRVYAYDRWGYGKSSYRAGIDMPNFSSDLLDLESLLDMLGLGKTTLVGHSDGGTIALYFAAFQPERVCALVSAAAHIYVEATMVPGIEVVRESYERDERFRKGLERLHGENTERAFVNWYEGWTANPANREWDMRPVLRQIQCPALIIQGVEDEHATPQHARDIAEAIPGAELWLMENAGHMLPQDFPEAFNQRVIAFLREAVDC